MFRAAVTLILLAVLRVSTFSAPNPVHGQEIAPTYTIRGEVTDVQGAPVNLTGRSEIRVFSIEAIRTQQGGADGKFAIGNLPPGDYEIEIRVPGFAPQIISDLHVKSDLEPRAIRMDIGLKIEPGYECFHPDHIHYAKAEANSASTLIGTIAGEGALEPTTVVVETFKERNAVAILSPDSNGAFQISLPAGKYIVMAFRKGDPQQTSDPVWITRSTVAQVRLEFPSAKSGILICQ
ncbi:MAG TPA: carboxypeptidase-like regulatory domain-containing protein [Candidatus Acidoferrales bacterium]|nr:carboxypeptidase-like regulatory domain-containing protein [Candidatus Acidoferrales bacterium]